MVSGKSGCIYSMLSTVVAVYLQPFINQDVMSLPKDTETVNYISCFETGSTIRTGSPPINLVRGTVSEIGSIGRGGANLRYPGFL